MYTAFVTNSVSTILSFEIYKEPGLVDGDGNYSIAVPKDQTLSLSFSNDFIYNVSANIDPSTDDITKDYSFKQAYFTSYEGETIKITDLNENDVIQVGKVLFFPADGNELTFYHNGEQLFDHTNGPIYIPIDKGTMVQELSNSPSTSGSCYSLHLDDLPTIEDILPDDFPTSEDTAWKNANGCSIYLTNSGTQLYTYDTIMNITTTLTKSGNDYTCNCGFYYMKFVMNNGSLNSIEIYDAGLSKVAEGTYSAPVTIEDILPSDFPTTADKAWYCNLGFMVYLNNGELLVEPDLFEIDITDTVTKVDDNYSYTNFNKNNKKNFDLILVMNNGTLVKMEATNIIGGIPSMTFEPLGDKKSIGDILNADFPTTKDNGWKNTNSDERIYCESGELAFKSGAKMGLPILTTAPLSLNGSNYTYTIVENTTFITFTVDDDDELEVIKITGFPGTIDGTYVPPHKVTDAPTTISKDNIVDTEFVTNAVYTNDTDVTVTMDLIPTPLVLNKDYTLSHGSTHVTLKASYLNTLSSGSHTLHIGVTGYDTVDKAFEITAATPSPTPVPQPTPIPVLDPERYHEVPNTGVGRFKH